MSAGNKPTKELLLDRDAESMCTPDAPDTFDHLNQDGRVNPEQALWLAVISQSFADLFTPAQSNPGYTPSSDVSLRARLEALNFLTADRGGWQHSRVEVCGLAGIDPDALRSRVLTEIRQRGETVASVKGGIFATAALGTAKGMREEAGRAIMNESMPDAEQLEIEHWRALGVSVQEIAAAYDKSTDEVRVLTGADPRTLGKLRGRKVVRRRPARVVMRNSARWRKVPSAMVSAAE